MYIKSVATYDPFGPLLIELNGVTTEEIFNEPASSQYNNNELEPGLQKPYQALDE